MGTNDGTDEGNGDDAGQTGGQSTGGQSTGGQSGGGQPSGGQPSDGQPAAGQGGNEQRGVEQAPAGQPPGGPPAEGQTPGGQRTSGHANTQSGLEPNVAGALCYAFGWLSGLFFYFTEEDDEFIRFHAAQSIVAFGAFTVIYIIVSQILWSMLFSAGGFGAWQLISMLNTLLLLAGLGLWLGMMYVAYDGRWFELPIAGDIANDMISGGSKTVERKPPQQQ